MATRLDKENKGNNLTTDANSFDRSFWPVHQNGSQNSSNCCLSLVFVGFNLLILCWLAGANDEVHSFKFKPYFLTFEPLGIFWRHISPKSCKKSIWAEKNNFFKIALKRVLILPKARSRQMRQFPLKMMGLQNKSISVVTKH